ncbi:MAG: aldehyde dehydrogenase (NADP(+)) [Bacteroidetes bacterium]|nr:aldehyde dehydrogenase (NADP(+)) [Bacteroidota bacterium]
MITQNIIGYETSQKGTETVNTVNPSTKERLEGDFVVATYEELEKAVSKAWTAWKTYRHVSGKKKASFLRQIASEIENIGDVLVERAIAESGLPEGRIRGERGRTCNQLRLFADLVEEGSWVNAVIETAMPERQPLPRVEIRNMLQSVGPVAVFGASNFPLAFSTAGGDTASALAAGCPVIVKAHSSHLGTNAFISEAISKAAEKIGMPDGVFSSLQDSGITVGSALVKHPKIKSVAFTGSFRGGMALHKAAMEREEPIPVFAEMGSTNPIFLLPNKIKNESSNLAAQLANSVNLGAGQFCTNPGLLVLLEDENTNEFIQNLKKSFESLIPSTMLNQGIFQNFEKGKTHCLNIGDVQAEYIHPKGNSENWDGYPGLASVEAQVFLGKEDLQEEVFGPFTLIIKCKTKDEIEAVANKLKGQLTATLMHSPNEVSDWRNLFNILQEKVGRLIFNGVPTGVEVGHSMQHGGPFPATTDGRFTSVGTGAIKRFARPIAFQNCPDALLPDALKAENLLGIWRLMDGNWTK